MKKLIKTLRTFYGFELKSPIFLGLLIMLVLATALTSSYFPFVYKYLIEEIQNPDGNRLVYLIAGYVGLRVLNLALNATSYSVGDMVVHTAAITARKKIFKHVQNLDFAFHTGKSSGSLISIFKRGDSAYYSIHFALEHNLLQILLSFVIMMVLFTRLNPLITVITAISFVISMLITQVVVSYNVKTRKWINDEEDKVSGIIVDNLINYETVKLFGKEIWEEKRLDRAFVDWLRAAWAHANSFRLIDVSIGGLINITVFLILYISAERLGAKQMSAGDFILMLGFVGEFFPKFWELVYSYRDLSKNFTDIEKYFDILDNKVEVKDPKEPVVKTTVSGAIEFDNVSFAYGKANRKALKNISIKIKPGESVALVGRSGSGKTTLTRLLMRFYDPDSGKITIDGVDIKKFTKSTLRSFMGVVPQEPILFNNTIAYNIGYGADSPSKAEIVAAARIANLDKFINTLKDGFDTQVGERGIKLSGGQKQRLAIARMILSNPDIIIFDEATSQLDSENERKIQQAFWRASENKSTIIIAHRLSTAMHANRIIVLENGKIIESGTHAELLLNEGGTYRYLWDLQVGGQ